MQDVGGSVFLDVILVEGVATVAAKITPKAKSIHGGFPPRSCVRLCSLVDLKHSTILSQGLPVLAISHST